ncbi:hypothetical protein NEOLEDRAFT_1118544 [Neolentinus lepideus HHB14362 ss-1]|uniref:DUF7729 domain-containing protein n=1 Tax=Neolentinus lepideus HHB14362 ss-1 TaxID=1314782 RepID=A0A165QX98_9AGAM|nr:hypothetical protein NEOLEDRAFT_1118544 [Neolentinus lepideus HHB14362 ss-1]
MKSIAIISLLVAGALAQSSASSATAASSTASALIPSGISSACSTYLTSLNSDSTLYSCAAPIISATSQFGAAANSGASSTSSVNSAIKSFCANSETACSASNIKSQLASFYSACTPELTASANSAVIRMYDALYSLTPLMQAVCSQDDSGNYCITQTASAANSSSSSGNLATAQKYLWYPQTSSKRAVSMIEPNATTFTNYNLPFLLLTGSTPSSTLCTSCTRSILTSYINFESSVPYGPGLSKSSLLSGQSALYQGVQSTCGESFMSGAVQAAGGIKSGAFSGAGRSVSVEGGALGVLISALSVAAAGFAAAL